MIAFNQVEFRFKHRPVMTNFNLRCGPGLTVLQGRNGAGKTTALRLAATIIRPQAGSVSVLGVESTDNDFSRLLGTISYMPQHTPRTHLTVRRWIEYGAWLAKAPKQRTVVRLDELVESLNLTDFVDSPMRGISGGQRKRADLARTLVSDPSVVLLDEPTSGLDVESVERVAAVVSKASRQGTCLLATHDAELISCLDGADIVQMSGSQVAKRV